LIATPPRLIASPSRNDMRAERTYERHRRAGLLLALAVLGGACDSGLTGVRLAIDADPALGIERYQIKLGDRVGLADVAPSIDVVTPEDMAGKSWKLEVWGLGGAVQLGYASSSVMLVGGELRPVSVELTGISCGDICELGSVRCMGDGVTTCEVTSDGCLAWGPVTACPIDEPFCSSGECAATCTDECAVGETACDGSLADKTCGNFDGDSCREWSTPTACGNGETCTGTSCSTSGCEVDGCAPPAAPVCTDMSNVRVTLPGTCEASGTCSYETEDHTCQVFGCTNGKCSCDCNAAYQCCLDVSSPEDDSLCQLWPIQCSSGQGVPTSELTDYVRMNCPAMTCYRD